MIKLLLVILAFGSVYGSSEVMDSNDDVLTAPIEKQLADISTDIQELYEKIEKMPSFIFSQVKLLSAFKEGLVDIEEVVQILTKEAKEDINTIECKVESILSGVTGQKGESGCGGARDDSDWIFDDINYADITDMNAFKKAVSKEFAPAKIASITKDANGHVEVDFIGDTSNLANTIAKKADIVVGDKTFSTKHSHRKSSARVDSDFVFDDINYADITDMDAFKKACSKKFAPAKCSSVTKDASGHIKVSFKGDTSNLADTLAKKTDIVVGDKTFHTKNFHKHTGDKNSGSKSGDNDYIFDGINFADITDMDAFTKACSKQFAPAKCTSITKDANGHVKVGFSGDTKNLVDTLAKKADIVVGKKHFSTSKHRKASDDVSGKCGTGENCAVCQNETCAMCAEGYYIGASNMCTQCKVNCEFCAMEFDGYQCLQAIEGYYVDEETEDAKKCQEHCVHCEEEDGCDRCEEGFAPDYQTKLDGSDFIKCVVEHRRVRY